VRARDQGRCERVSSYEYTPHKSSHSGHQLTQKRSCLHQIVKSPSSQSPHRDREPLSATVHVPYIGHTERPFVARLLVAPRRCHTHPLPSTYATHARHTPRTSRDSRSCSRSRTESVRAAARRHGGRHGSTTIMIMRRPQSMDKGHVCPSCPAQARPRAL